MIDEIKEPVTDVTENVEQATEELVNGTKETEQVTEEPKGKFYTNEEIKKIKLRYGERIRKDYDKKYGKLESVLRAGTGSEGDIEEMANTFDQFYTQNVKGYKSPTEPTYSSKDLEVLARVEADEMIETYDFSELEEEANRLADIGVDNMTARERLVFTRIGDYLMQEQSRKELASIGVTEKDLKDKDYIEFKKNLNPNMPEKDKYEMYTKYRPKPMVEPIGSMKGTVTKDTAVKDFYTREEAMQFTKAELDKNPELYKAIETSMLKW